MKRAEQVLEAGRPELPVLRRPDRPRRAPVRAGQRLPAPRSVTAEPSVDLLEGELVLHGRIMPASNATFLGDDRRRAASSTSRSRGSGRCGTSPTAPSPTASARRTCVSEAFGWDVVPRDLAARRAARPGHGAALAGAGRGAGGGRRWCAEGEVPTGWRHVFDGIDDHDQPVSLVHEDTAPLRRMAVFDVLVNNADRKGGHVLAMTDGHRYGVDHGVTFHAEHKLRTVLWGWLGRAAQRRRGRGGRARCGAAVARRARATRWPGTSPTSRSRRWPGAAAGSPTARVMPAPRGEWPAIPWPPVLRTLHLAARLRDHACLAVPGDPDPARHRARPVALHDTAVRWPGHHRPRRPGPAVRLRHHAVRRHPPRPRRDLRRLRPAQPGLAQRRPRGHLRPERHRRRRPAARAGRRRCTSTGWSSPSARPSCSART